MDKTEDNLIQNNNLQYCMYARKLSAIGLAIYLLFQFKTIVEVVIFSNKTVN